MTRVTKLFVVSTIALGCSLFLRARADQTTTRAGGDSTAARSGSSWIKAEFAADARGPLIGLPNAPVTRWVNLDKADQVYFYKTGEKEEARVETGAKVYLTSDPKQLQLIHRFLAQGELR